MQIETDRLRLRAWAADDLHALTRLNADPEVNRWLGGPAIADRSAEALNRMRTHVRGAGWGVAAVCDKAGALLGLAGFQPVHSCLPAAPAVEAVWRLQRSAWGQGYIAEAMAALLGHAAPPDSSAVVCLIARCNLRSTATAIRLGFTPDPTADFDHPLLDQDDPLRAHRVFTRRDVGRR